MAINCSAIPENLLESELFGHAKGAFTGAQEKKIGLFEEAQDGTLFLDEIGDLPASLQAKLLRVFQEKKIRRVGENVMRPINCRIISATHKNLIHEIAEGRFREDLYFRLNVIPISHSSIARAPGRHSAARRELSCDGSRSKTIRPCARFPKNAFGSSWITIGAATCENSKTQLRELSF